MKAKTKKTLMWVAAISAVAVVGYVVIKKGSTATAPAPTPIPSTPASTATRIISFFK